MSIVTKLVGAVSRMLDALFFIVCSHFYGQKAVSHIDNPLILQSASSIARKLRQGEITSAEVVKAYIGRIQEVDAQINVIVQDLFADALREAEQVDAELSKIRREEPEEANSKLDALFASKPFYGVPTSVKSTFAVRGALWHSCLISRANVRAEYDAGEVTRLRAAGFIVLCTTAVPEMAMWMETVSMIRNRTLNPYNASRGVGGSSGGEAALVAAGGVPVGLASDVGGSIRIPSSYCGVFGHKATSDSASHFCDPVSISESGQRRNNHYPIMVSQRTMRMLGFGPLCRYAEDLWPALLASLHEADRARVSHNGCHSPATVNLKRTKFLYFRAACEDTPDGLTASSYFINNPDRLTSEALERVIEFVRSELHADIEPLKFVGDEFRSLKLVEVADIWQAYMYLPDELEPACNEPTGHWSSENARKAAWRTFDGKSWLERGSALETHSNGQTANRISVTLELLKKMLFWPLNLLGIQHPFQSRITTPILFCALNEKAFQARSFESHKQLLQRGALLERAFQELFAAHKRAGYEHVIILCPTMPCVAPYHGKPVICSPFDVVYPSLFNVLGLPATVAPILKDRASRTNLPATVQIVSDKFDDAASIAFAEALERAFGGWKQPSEAQ